MNITCVILAGGRGTRMGGVDKGLVLFDGKPLVQHVIKRIRPQVSNLLINANRSHGEYTRFGYPVISDDTLDGVEEFAGPLAGMLTALIHANTELVLIAPCDTPLLPLDLAARLHAQLVQTDTRACIAHDGTRAHPTCALLHVSLRDELRAALLRGDRKAERWLHSIGCSSADVSDVADAFININSPGDGIEI